MPVLSNVQKAKSARLSCRVRVQIKERAEEAAQLLGMSITDFAEAALEEKARRVISEHERILISERAFTEFVSIISDTPEMPSEKLLAAVAKYREHSPIVGQS